MISVNIYHVSPQPVAFQHEGLYDHHRDPIVKLKEPRTFKELVTYIPFDIRDLDDESIPCGRKWWGEFLAMIPYVWREESTWFGWKITHLQR